MWSKHSKTGQVIVTVIIIVQTLFLIAITIKNIDQHLNVGIFAMF